MPIDPLEPASPGLARPVAPGCRYETPCLAVALLLAVVAVYSPVRSHEFLALDDRRSVVENPLLEGALDWGTVSRTFATPWFGNWIPLTTLSLRVGRALHGGSATGVLLGNVLLHGLATVLLFLALARMTGDRWPSAFAAAVFGLHPLHVESVAWASERKDVLAGFWWMVSLCAWARYAERPTVARYTAVCGAFALALLSKPMVVTLPFVLLLLDYWPLRRLRPVSGGPTLDPARVARAILEKVPLLALSAGLVAVTLTSQSSDGAFYPLEALPLSERVLNAILSYGAYLGDAFWPAGLAAFYPHPGSAIEPTRVAVAGAVLLAVSAAALRLAVRAPFGIVGWLWYLGTLVPVIGLVQVGMQARADRYTYLPLIGISLMVAWSANEGARRSRAARTAFAAAGATAVVAMLAVTSLQLRHWSDSEAVFRRAIAVTERNFPAHAGLGFVLRDAGRHDEALRHFEEAVRIEPAFGRARVALAGELVANGRNDEAVAELRRALVDVPTSAAAHGNLGVLLADEGRHAEATPHLRLAVALRSEQELPPSPAVHAALGDTLSALGDPAAGLAHYEVSLQDRPDDPQLHARAGVAAQLAGRPASAIDHYRAALYAAPGFDAAANNLAWLLATCSEPGIRNPDEALRVLEELESSDPPARLLDTWAAAYAAAGRFARAREVLARAIAAAADEPELADAMRARARAFERREAVREACARGEPGR